MPYCNEMLSPRKVRLEDMIQASSSEDGSAMPAGWPKTAERPRAAVLHEVFSARRSRLKDKNQASSSEDGRSAMAAAATWSASTSSSTRERQSPRASEPLLADRGAHAA